MSLREDAKKLYTSSLAKLDPSGTVFDYLSSNKIVSSNYNKIYPVAFGKASISMMSGFLDYLSKEKHLVLEWLEILVLKNLQENILHFVMMMIYGFLKK